MRRLTNRRSWLACAVLAAAVDLVAGAARAELDEAIRLRTQTNQGLAQGQETIDKLSDQTDALAAEYRAALAQAESLRVYNRHIEDLLAAQEREMASLREQIDDVTVVGREVTPLMLRMVDALDAFVQLDLPFLPEERSGRVAHLRELMARADVTDSEKYRRLLEAYQIENEYGRTIEAYQGSIGTGDQTRTVDFLRVGRVALLYQTLDAKEQGVWDRAQQQWTPLGSEYRTSIRQALRIARKQAAPDLVYLPIPAAVAASEGGQ
jgi:hypothetical protein